MTKKYYSRVNAHTRLGIVMLALGTPALAQTSPASPTANTEAASEIPEIVVTAEKRSSSIQKTAIAITALDGAALAKQGKTTLEDALRDISGVTVQSNNNSSTYTIRGIRPAASTDPAANVNRDGIFQSNDGVTPNFDVARLEVLKGPQGTLYGRNAIGGVINIVNNEPRFKNGGYASITLGTENLVNVEGALNLALSDTVASRTSVYSSKHDGYLSNGNDDDDSIGVRQKFRIEPTDELSISLTGEYDHTKANGHGTVYAPLSSHPNGDPYFSALQKGGVINDKYALYGTLSYDFGSAVLNIIPSYYRVTLRSDSDLQGQGLQASQLNGRQSTLEVRLSAPSSSKILWQVGGYHLHYREVLDQFSNPISNGIRAMAFAPPGITPSFDISDNSTDSLAGFGQITVPLADDFRATGGIRYTRDVKELTTDTRSQIDRSLLASTPKQRVEQSSITWKVGIEYDVTSRSLFYADVSKGFKSGGLNQLGVPVGLEAYEPEKLYGYEIGLKNRFLDNTLQLNFDGFYYDYAKKQFQAVQPRVGTYPLLVTFSGAARVYGGEVQLDWQFTKTDRISGGVGYTHTEITDFNYPGFPSRVGERLENSPEWSGNARYEHAFTIRESRDLTASATLHFQTGADTVTDLVTDDYQNAFQKLDLALSYHNSVDDFTVTLYGNNVSNVTTRSRGFPRPFGIAADTLTLDPPRTYGISFRKDF